MSLSLDQQHQLRSEVRKHVDSIGSIYPTVGQAMFEEAAQRLAERISHRMIEPLFDAATAAYYALSGLVAASAEADKQRITARAGLEAVLRVGRQQLVGPPPDRSGPLSERAGPLGELVAASEELCRNALAGTPLLQGGQLVEVVPAAPAAQAPCRHKLVVSHNGHPLVLLDVYEFSLPSDILNWYAKHYAFERAKLSYTFVDTLVVPHDPRTGVPLDNPAPYLPGEHPRQP